MKEYVTNSVEETIAAAEQVAAKLNAGDIILYEGDMGAGKTHFTKGIAKYLGIDDEITSPTFALVNEYDGALPLFHFDLYRITSEEDLYGMGFDEYVDSGYCIAEWCEHIGTAMPDDAITVKIEKIDDTSRRITISEEL